jgi:probable O-glycosylation ligase (exosortase A-associated)
MRDIALAGFFFSLLPFVLTRPHWGILIWTWLSLMNPQFLTYSFARSIPYAQIVGVATLVAFAISSEKKSLPLGGVVVTFLLFTAWMTLTTVFSLYPDLAWPYWQLVIKIQLMTLLTIIVMQTKERIVALVWVSVLSLAFYGVKGGLWTIARGGNVMVQGPGGFVSENNSLAVAFAMTLPLLYWLYLQSGKRWQRYGLVGAFLLTAIATLGTFSRGGLLALGGMGMWLWFRSRQRLAIVLVIAVLVPVAFSLMPDAWFTRMGTIRTYEQDTSAMARINAWVFAWNLASDRLLGGGYVTFQPDAFEQWGPDATQFGLEENTWHDAHSIWFKVLGEHGFIGLALYMLFWYLTWRVANGIRAAAADRPELTWARDLAAMVQVSLIAFWVGGSFLGFPYWDYPLVLVAVLVTTRAVIDREASASTCDRQSTLGATGVASGKTAAARKNSPATGAPGRQGRL